MSTETTAGTTVRRSIVVDAPIDRAFDVFTNRFAASRVSSRTSRPTASS